MLNVYINFILFSFKDLLTLSVRVVNIRRLYTKFLHISKKNEDIQSDQSYCPTLY